MPKMTHDEFVQKINDIYDSKYKVIGTYKNTGTKVEILCPEHGVWNCWPIHLINGHKCAGCAGLARHTTESYIEKVKILYGEDRYDYSLIEYKTIHDKIKIICKLHGLFEIEANHFLHNHGCAECAGNKHSTTEGFISKSKKYMEMILLIIL